MIEVSVVVPVYNVEKYVENCVNSLLDQDFNGYEIILVDDGSTDNSSAICDNLAKKYDIINLVHKKNEGLGFARNTGLNIVQGKYVIFIDADDYCERNLISTLYGNVRQGCDACIGGQNRVSQDGRIIDKYKYDDMIYEGKNIFEEFIPRLVGSDVYKKDSISVSACNVIYSMKVISENNLRFCSERDIISEDLIFNLMYFSKAKKISLVSECSYNYRVNIGSLTTKYRSDRLCKVKEVYFLEKKLLNNMEIYENCKYRLIRQYFIFLKMCISQEKKYISHLSKQQSLNNIKFICKDSLTVKVINEYPVNGLQFKQKIFVLLIKYKLVGLLYFLFNHDIIK